MAAFTRVLDLATVINNAEERFSSYYGLWVGSLQRGSRNSRGTERAKRTK
jgi:hypothetical protein